MQLPTVFVSYSHKDKDLKDKVVTQLRVLEAGGQLHVWDDDVINAGEDWFDKIEEAIKNASAAILLVSANFLTSEFIHREEIPRLLQQRKDKGLHVFPFIIRASAWSRIGWLNQMQVRPLNGKPLFSYRGGKRDEVLTEFVMEVQDILQSSTSKGTTGSLSLKAQDVSIVRLPVTGPNLFGRDEELRMLDKAWASRKTNIVSFVAWGGVGKSALVNHWLNRMREKNYRGAEKVFGWSFYSQGTRDETSSADLFLASALRWFGDLDFEGRNQEEKGQRLAEVIRNYRTLLILDGLEPLQHGPGERKGRLKQPGIERLLRELATINPGLCVVSSRLPLTDLTAYVGTAVERVDLEQLRSLAGRHLLESEGAWGSNNDMKKTSNEFGGHALALSILGHFLKMAVGGDIRRRDKIGPLSHDPERGGHARRVIDSIVKWFRDDPKQQVALESLEIMGLFDRPIGLDVWKALIKKPAIKSLTGHISTADEWQWLYALGVLRDAHLLTETDPNNPDTIDCHPLIREHFSEELQKSYPNAWKQAHKRLFKFFCPKTKEPSKTVEEMASYYQAITHACFAGLHREGFNKVYMPYIRQYGAYNTEKLRAFADDYAALSRFLQKRRFKVVSRLSDHSSFILGEIGFDLRALGRLDEAIEFMNAALAWDKIQEHPSHRINAARQADILSTTYLILGSVKEALKIAEEAVKLAKEDDYHRMICLTTRADAKHHAGDLDGAENDFLEAESINKRIFSDKGWLYLRSFQGSRYCNYLLTKRDFDEVTRRLKKTMEWDEQGGYPTPLYSIPLHALQTEGQVLPLALDRLVFARALLTRDAGSQRRLQEAEEHLNKALKAIKESATRHLWPRGLLVKAQWLRAKGETKRSKEMLKECLFICVRDKMKLYEADCLFELALLCFEEAKKNGAKTALKRAFDDLERLSKTSDEMGYGLLKERIATSIKRGYNVQKPYP